MFKKNIYIYKILVKIKPVKKKERLIGLEGASNKALDS